MNVKEAQRSAETRQQWAGCDPFTLVSAAKETLYGEISSDGGSSRQHTTEQLAPIEEVISRFEQLSRASLGSATPVGSKS